MYVKIVPSPAITEILYPSQIFECDRLEYRVAVGKVDEVAGEVTEHLNHYEDPQLESLSPLFWCREVLEPRDGWIGAALLTLHQVEWAGRPVRLVAAYECTVFMMNDKGVTFDKVNAIRKTHPPAADKPVRGSSEDSKRSDWGNVIGDPRKFPDLARALDGSVQPQSSGTGKMCIPAGERFRGSSKSHALPPPPPIVMIKEDEVGPRQ